jgi:hypothetical protein
MRVRVRVSTGLVVATEVFVSAGLLVAVLVMFLAVTTIGMDGHGCGVLGTRGTLGEVRRLSFAEKLSQAVLTAKVKRLSIAFGMESGRFVHGHFAYWVFDDGFRFFHCRFSAVSAVTSPDCSPEVTFEVP